MDASLPPLSVHYIYICTIVHRLPNFVNLLPSWHSLHRTSTRIPATPPLFDVKGPGCRMAWCAVPQPPQSRSLPWLCCCSACALSPAPAAPPTSGGGFRTCSSWSLIFRTKRSPPDSSHSEELNQFSPIVHLSAGRKYPQI
jgi:hypothetical protein